MEHKFKMYDWDEGCFYIIPKNNIVDAIHYAWNYEFDVYDRETGELIFSGQEDDDFNSEMLEPYGIRLIENGTHRCLQTIETGEIHLAEWQ
ncbi:hypothetical protein Bcp1_116 [Bacillus phage Bcp1]|uniref:Uncharacterized protein n=1 Tax=Bacillus phage Bcp1 TaxID=584892 RepID=X2JUJ9_9CAUD|nr:hypothetical protein Bcp1_116 [Bacillus phage Bcp1]AHN66591.1 hypothetical protein Bcp1_116 [Bacillus phage Bcp1]AXQ67783.1 hypothetical protein KIOSHI_123 [Bacillus phage Kioshi]